MLYLMVKIFVIFSISKLNYGLVNYSYHNFAQLESILKQYNATFTSKTYLYSIGKSVEGRNLWVMALSDSQPDKHLPLRPEVKYIGSMHGNEVPGKEVLLHFIDYLLNNQTTDSNVDYLMKNMRIHIMPSMNPDGFEVSEVGDCYSVQGRNNKEDIDLNRNFPDLYSYNYATWIPAKETKFVIDWLNNFYFILSANFHAGAVVASYPFDDYPGSDDYTSVDWQTNDSNEFIGLALAYATNNTIMPSNPCDVSTSINGITNGANWYPVIGGMQDFNYWAFGCMEITLEISCCKYPRPSQLEEIWNQNRQSLISYLKKADTGIKGFVKFSNGAPAANLSIQIDNREPIFKTNNYGEYYRILNPGTYVLKIKLDETIMHQKTIIIPSNSFAQIYNVTLDQICYELYSQVQSQLHRYSQFVTKSTNEYYGSAAYLKYLSLLPAATTSTKSTSTLKSSTKHNPFDFLSVSTKQSASNFLIFFCLFFLFSEVKIFKSMDLI